MNKICATFQAWAHCRDGATAIEYGLIVAAVGLTIATAVWLFGGNTAALYDDIGQATANANPQ